MFGTSWGLALFFFIVVRWQSAWAEPADLLVQRQRFLQAEQAIKQDQAEAYRGLADTLQNYPLYPYLHYQWLQNHLTDAPAVERYLQEFSASRYAPLLRQKWLEHLGKNQQWPQFIEAYRPTTNNQLQCYLTSARQQTGQEPEALDLARSLWLNGKSQPENCTALFVWFKTSSLFSTDLVWQRFRAALTVDNQALAASLLADFGDADRALATTWLNLHRQPETVKNPGDWKQHPQAAAIFAHVIQRWLDSNPVAAAAYWDAEQSHFALATETTSQLEKNLGIALALRRDPGAYQRLTRIALQEATAREWRVRAALQSLNWSQVNAALAALDDGEKRQDKWQYWQARAWAEIGENTLANNLWQQLAQQRSFYGFLAANKLHQAIKLEGQAIQVATTDIEQLKQTSDFQIVAEWLALERKQEAKQQWWFAIAKLEPAKLLVAAKLAQQWQWPSIAIFTAAKAEHWDDLDLRFPLHYQSQIELLAQQNNIDPALVFALIRQESAFDEQADSPAGAKGLMQLMPNTGKQIAAELQDSWSNAASLFDPAINLKYGTQYYQKLLRQFNGNPALAAAAYNAGSNRVKNWLPKSGSLPADIWIETIPYKETRGYVASVLMYALIYQYRLQRNGLQTDQLMRDIAPG